MAKYLSIGNVMNGEHGEYYQLDNLKLKEFLDFLKAHGEKYLKGLSDDEIKDGQRAKEIPRLSIYRFDPNDGAPDFIIGNLAVKK